jgi:hypothetical protein
MIISLQIHHPRFGVPDLVGGPASPEEGQGSLLSARPAQDWLVSHPDVKDKVWTYNPHRPFADSYVPVRDRNVGSQVAPPFE